MYNYFRIVIPRIIVLILRLAKDIIDKHLADGLSSKLNSMNMTLFISKYNQANTQHNLAEQLARDKETAIMERNLALGIAKNQYSYTPNTVKYYVYSIRDFLLGYFKGREQLMGDWQYSVNMSSGNVRVVIPNKSYELLRLTKSIIDKHAADGASSILAEFDMAAFEALYNLAKTKDELAEKLKRDKESAFLVRNQLLGIAKGQDLNTPDTLLNLIVSVRDALKGFHKGSEQLLGNWGFTVNTSTPTPDPDPNPDPDPDPNPPIPTVIAGIVREMGTSTPIEGANIQINTSVGMFVAISSDTGSFSITLPDTIEETETANIIVLKDGYLPYVQAITIVPNVSIVFDFFLDPA